MASDLSSPISPVRLAVEGRETADALLRDLLSDQRRSEERLAATGKDDPLKDLTGSSAIERAIASTRQMISSMDELLAELRREVAGGTEPSRRNGPTIRALEPRPELSTASRGQPVS